MNKSSAISRSSTQATPTSDTRPSSRRNSMAIDPTGADLKQYLADDPGGPVVMLNLLRYKTDGGEASYREYGRRTGEFLAKVGGEVLYAGDGSTALVAEDGQ